MKKQKPLRTSEVLSQIIEKSGAGSITLGEFVQTLGDRAFGLAILIFALPNSLPIPGIPGVSTVTGLPITFFGLQMLLGRKALWMPKRLASREFSGEFMGKVLRKALPTVIWLEKYLKPRLHFMSNAYAERFIGLLMVLLSLIVALPIPLGNFLPGITMSILAIGMLERDGVFLVGGVLFSLSTVALMSTLITLFFEGVASAINMIF